MFLLFLVFMLLCGVLLLPAVADIPIVHGVSTSVVVPSVVDIPAMTCVSFVFSTHAVVIVRRSVEERLHTVPKGVEGFEKIYMRCRGWSGMPERVSPLSSEGEAAIVG